MKLKDTYGVISWSDVVHPASCLGEQSLSFDFAFV
jgi:hypothetical protein